MSCNQRFQGYYQELIAQQEAFERVKKSAVEVSAKIQAIGEATLKGAKNHAK